MIECFVTVDGRMVHSIIFCMPYAHVQRKSLPREWPTLQAYRRDIGHYIKPGC